MPRYWVCRLTAVVHIAGTAGDRASTRSVKASFETLLGLPVTAAEEHVYDAGTRAARHALQGRARRDGWRGLVDRVWPRCHLRGGGDQARPRVWIETYYPLLNYPVANAVTLTAPGASSPFFTASLMEDDVPQGEPLLTSGESFDRHCELISFYRNDAQDPTSREGRTAVPSFHGLSKNGSATGRLVYAGRGTRAEFAALRAAGIDLAGTIALVQYGGSFRGSK